MKAYKLFMEEKHTGRTYLLPCSGNGLTVMVGSGYRPPTTKRKRVVRPVVGKFTCFDSKANAVDFLHTRRRMLEAIARPNRPLSMWEIDVVGPVSQEGNLHTFAVSLACYSSLMNVLDSHPVKDRIRDEYSSYSRYRGLSFYRTTTMDLPVIGQGLVVEQMCEIPVGTLFCDGFRLVERVRFLKT